MTPQQHNDRVEAIRQKAWRTRYMAGWDARIIDAPISANPYRREDFRRTWEHGWSACDVGRALPHWYAEWRSERAA